MAKRFLMGTSFSGYTVLWLFTICLWISFLGSALRAFRSIEGGAEAKAVGDFLKKATGKDLFQLKEEAKLGASLDTPEKVSKFIQDSKKPSFGDMLLEYLINGLVSGPATHTTYGIGNTLLGLWKAIPETTVASLLGKIRG